MLGPKANNRTKQTFFLVGKCAHKSKGTTDRRISRASESESITDESDSVGERERRIRLSGLLPKLDQTFSSVLYSVYPTRST